MKKRFTPENITHLADNEVLEFGAVMGQGTGLFGQTYAIPTKDEGINTMPITEIAMYVCEFIDDAAINHPDKTFLVTKIGCGLAGYEVSDIAPLFADSLDLPNIVLPVEFHNFLKQLNA